MNIRLLTSLLTITLLLSSCNLFNVIPTVDLNVSIVDGLDPGTVTVTQILIEVSGDAADPQFAVPPLRLKAYGQPGSIASNITGYSIDYFYATGDKINTSTGESFRGTLAMNIPAGISCAATSPCTINAPDVSYTKTEDVYSDPFRPIEADIVRDLFFGTNPIEGAYASISIEGKDANGNFFSNFLSPVTIVFTAG